MAATATAPPCEEQVQVRRERRPCAGSRGISLGQLLARAHESVHEHGSADCPVCGGSLEPSTGGASCTRCGSRLA
jgi:hypothetical protein